ncbi:MULTISPECIES: hypothetical protein [unclassified Variovorax]|uniref:HalD/BesD family halogenase n=1 Tax=unclassified Variovorax TaxID=663243 RepID=UPI0008380049|nr:MULTISPECIES: hypothetical protein [unclassified Variovorax]PNG52243.1 hypothetical protein CHC07_04615 [Variovorax sp. B4]PNG54783.1 hypothetical protein CHC06_03581 [Variovorax sp. B2]VTV15784.1 hypothetical protein WDL1CHR_06155 [Variovorax sp. WDL1]
MNFKQNRNDVDALLAAHFSGFGKQVQGWRKEFDLHQCVKIGNFIPHALQADLHKEARRLLAEKAERRNVKIASTGNTPRSYRSVGRDAIRATGLVTPALFHSDTLLMLLSIIAGEKIYRIPYAPEEYIINNQCGPGDTHGWHWDDYTFALIHVVESPNPLSGGRIEYIQNVIWDKMNSEKCVKKALENRLITSMHVQSGETYFMKTNTTLHRISPLTEDSNRIAIIYSFASEDDLTDPSIEHATMEVIYPTDTAAHLVQSLGKEIS